MTCLIPNHPRKTKPDNPKWDGVPDKITCYTEYRKGSKGIYAQHTLSPQGEYRVWTHVDFFDEVVSMQHLLMSERLEADDYRFGAYYEERVKAEEAYQNSRLMKPSDIEKLKNGLYVEGSTYPFNKPATSADVREGNVLRFDFEDGSVWVRVDGMLAQWNWFGTVLKNTATRSRDQMAGDHYWFYSTQEELEDVFVVEEKPLTPKTFFLNENHTTHVSAPADANVIASDAPVEPPKRKKLFVGTKLPPPPPLPAPPTLPPLPPLPPPPVAHAHDEPEELLERPEARS